jgi:TP901 family phage tail tape measure protein
MADVNANIGVSIDTSDALNQLKNLQKQISQFHQSVAKSSAQAAASQRDLQKNFVSSINSIQGFSAELKTVRTTAESFTNSLEKNKFSIREYFRYAGSQTKTFGKNFGSEFDAIEKTAIERVKTLQTQYIKMGRDASGAMQAIAVRPTVLNMRDLGTQTAIAAQKQVLFNQLVKQGSTNLLNFGKNTQWAGRQLMVGFTLPLATLGMTAGRVFMDMEKAAIKFKKVYGDLFTAPEETQKAMDSITELGIAYTKYGVAVADSLDIAADAAAAGFEGVDLQRQTQATLKLSVLGQLELNKALETTIALQNAFRISSEDLGGTIDFLNAVENQTVVALDDITTAIPRVAPVIQALGGDVKDLAFFLAAMKEGGVNAAQGANALKSGLASLINPSEKSAEFLGQLGINIRSIVSQNQGDLRGTVLGFAQALDKLDPMKRAQAIEQLFGKFQFARISALFDNVIREGSQASRVLDLAGASLSELSALSESELGVSAASSMNKFKASIEEVKVALAPLGELFLDIATPFIEFATTVLKAFNSLPDGIKKTIGTVITVIGGIGPILLMTFGLINNGIANMIKFFATVRLGYLKMTGQAKGIGDETHYMTQEQLEAAAAAASLDQAHSNLTQRFTAEKVAVDALRDAYEQAAAAGTRFAINYPGMMKPGFVANPTKMAKGGVVTVGGRGNRDTEPALLTPGEAVIPAPMAKKYAPVIQGMISGNIPGYNGGKIGYPVSKSATREEIRAKDFYEDALGGTPGGMRSLGGEQYYVKRLDSAPEAAMELLTSALFSAMGNRGPQLQLLNTRHHRVVASKIIPGLIESDRYSLSSWISEQPDPKIAAQEVAQALKRYLEKDVPFNAAIGNFDAHHQNILFDPIAKVFQNIDLGNSVVTGHRVRSDFTSSAYDDVTRIKEDTLKAFSDVLGPSRAKTIFKNTGMSPSIKGTSVAVDASSQIDEMASLLGFDLTQDFPSSLATNPESNPFIKQMIAENPKLAKRLKFGELSGRPFKEDAGHILRNLFNRLKQAKANPTYFYADGVASVPGGRGNNVSAMLTPGEAVIPKEIAKKYAPLVQGMIAGNIPGYAKGVMLGMPKSAKSVSKSREAAEQVYEMFLNSSYANTPPTEYGHQISPTSGHSFPIFGLGGVYQKGNKQVFVKPVLDEKAALAEMRSTEISRMAHGLEAPQQKISVIRDPLDTTRTRRFLALESDLDPKFINNQPMGLFNEEQYFRQLVASLLRADKDLSGANVFGNVVADAGPAGVFNRASGLRDYDRGLPSMEDQAIINLLGIKGGAKRAFAESTLGLMAGLTPEQYHQKMLAEIQKVLPALQQTIASFQLTDPTEVGVYDDMVRRLQEGLSVDWSKFHAIHSAVKPAKPKAPTQAAPQNLANGGMVRGPGGPKDDAIPANLSNGEAVIDAATVKKNPAVISALFNKKKIQIPGYAENNSETFSFGPERDIRLGGRDPAEALKILNELRNVTQLIDGMDEVLYQALVRLGKAINPSNLNKLLSQDPSLQLLRSPVIGKGRKTGSQGAVKMHAGGAIEIANVDELKGLISAEAMTILKEGNAKNVRLLQNMVFGGPAAANKEKLSGQEFAFALDSNEGKDAFMRYIAEAGNIPPDHPDLRRFAEAVRQKLLAAGTDAVTDTMFAQIIQEALAEEIDDVGKNTTQVVKDAFREAKKYSSVASSIQGDAARSITLLPNQNFSVGDQQVESITTSQNYRKMETPEIDDLLFDNKTLEIIRQRATEAGYEVGRIFAITAGQSAIDAARANSPSRETVDASESLVDGVTTTIVNAKDEVEKATEEVISTVSKKIRRISTDPKVQADIDRRNQELTQATKDSANIAAGRPRGYKRASREGDLEARQRQQADTTLVNENDQKQVGIFSNSLSRASLAIGSVTGLMSMFGADLGGIAPVISMVSSALFTLSMISQQLAGTKIAEAASGRALQVANAMGAKTMGDLFVKGAGLGGFLSNFGKGLSFALRFIGPIGIGLGALAISFTALSKIAEDQKAKIEGLGNAAFLTAEKMALAGSLLGFTPKEINFAASFTRPEGTTAEQATSAAELAANETFFKENFYGVNILGAPIGVTLTDTAVGFGKEIEAIKKASVEEAQLAIQAIAIRTIASGGDAEAVAVLTGAILEAADRKEISLDVATNIDLATPEGQAKLSEIGAGSSKLVSDALSSGFNPKNGFDDEQQKVINQASGTYATLFAALRSGLDSGTISAETFNTEMAAIKAQLSEMDPAVLRVIGPAIAEKLGVSKIFDEISGGILTAEDRILALQAAAAGISIDTTDIKLIIDGYGNAIPDAITAADEARNRWRAGAEDNAIVVEETNVLDALKAELDAINEKIRANKAQIAIADKLIAAGLDEADALAAVTDETWMNIFAKAEEADLIAGTTEATDKAIESYNSLKESTEDLTDAQNRASYADWKNGILEQNDALAQLEAAGVPTATAIEIINNAAARSAAIAAANSGNLAAWLEEYKSIQAIASKISSSGGGGQKSPFQEAIDKLKEQQKEIKNSIIAYAGLRSAGFRVSEAFEIAGDSILAAALASQKVGTQKWNQLVTAIRAAKAEEEAWLNTTPEGRAQHWSDVYSKVMDVFNAQEDVLKMNNEAATAANREMIKVLERQIEVYTRRVNELQRDLDKIAEKEDEINKAYDEKTKALEKVKKLNQDIINQQKSQISIADALSRGDISAAAEAMQDARAQSAAAQGDATGNALDAARQAQLDALTENGKTRKQIEDEIKQIKKDIADIEFGALQNARDAVEAAEEALEAAVENLRVQGQSKTEWENIDTRINAAKASASLYESEVLKALENAKGLVGEWSKLEDTFTTTHVVNVVTNNSGGLPDPDTSNKFGPVGRAGRFPGEIYEGTGGKYSWNVAKQSWDKIQTASVAGPQGGGGGRAAPVMFASGGYISGPGTPTSDSIPAMLSDGEYVIKASSVNKFGTQFLDSVNSGQLPKFRLGGMVMDGGRSSSTATPSFGPIGRRGFYPGEIVNKGGVNYSWSMSTNSWSAVKSSASAASAKPAVSSVAANPATPFQNFEAGFQSVMASVAENPIVQSIGNFVMGSAPVRSLLAVASTPVEIVGAYAKNLVDTIGSVKAKAKQKDFLGIASSVISHALSAVPKSIGRGTLNAFSGVIDPSKMQPTMFEKAGQSAINNDLFGAKTNPEMASLARIIGGTLNLAADPLMYVGIGAIAKGLQASRTGAAAAQTSLGVTRKKLDLGEQMDYAYSTDTFQIGSNKPILFEGIGQDFSELAGPGLSVVKTTPVGLIEEALKILPPGHSSIPALKQLMDNFKNKKFGPDTKLFLDKMQASSYFNDLGISSKGDLGGLATFISSLAGDAGAIGIVNRNVAKLYETEAANKAAAEAAAKAGLAGNEGVANLDILTAFMRVSRGKSGYRVTREPNGDILLHPSGNYLDDNARSSSHWTVGGPVENHGFNQFGGVGSTTIVTGLKKLIDDNGMPYNLHPNDTWWTINPGETLRVSDAILATSNSPANHAAEVLKRGLVPPGSRVPPVVFDDKLKEFLYEVKEVYSEADRLRLKDFGYDTIPGFENRIFEKRVLEQAAKMIDKDSYIRTLDQWSTGDIKLNAEVPNLAAKMGIPSILHGNARISRNEYLDPYKYPPSRLNMMPKDSIHDSLDFDSLEALRHEALKGYFINKVSNEYVGRPFAKGGLVKPSYFAKGGMVPKYFANGGMIKLPKREAPPPQMSKGGMVPKYFANGGMVPKYFSDGGFAKGTDTVPAMLTPGEFVINRKAASKNKSLLSGINSGNIDSKMPKSYSFETGNVGVKIPKLYKSLPIDYVPRDFNSPVYNIPSRNYSELGGSAGIYSSSNTASSLTSNDNSVYNYSLSVNVDGTNASANDIANVVMGKIKNIQSQQVRRQGVR